MQGTPRWSGELRRFKHFTLTHNLSLFCQLMKNANYVRNIELFVDELYLMESLELIESFLEFMHNLYSYYDALHGILLNNKMFNDDIKTEIFEYCKIAKCDINIITKSPINQDVLFFEVDYMMKIFDIKSFHHIDTEIQEIRSCITVNNDDINMHFENETDASKYSVFTYDVSISKYKQYQTAKEQFNPLIMKY